MILPPEAHALVQVLAPHFSSPTYQRFSTLMVAALVTTGRRTVANLLRTLRHLTPGHRTDYQRVLSRAPWSGLALGCALMRVLLDHLLPAGPVMLVGDDTVDGHRGKCVYGKARHRDAVRASHSYTTWRYGHTWVVPAVLVRFPFATRPWALPVLIDLYRSEEDDRKRNRPHRTPARIMCALVRVLLIRFPNRTFVFAGDGGYGTHEVARFCRRHRGRLTRVSTSHPDANLFEPPPPYAGYAHGNRALVQSRSRSGGDPPGVRPRHHRHAPQRILLHDGRRAERVGRGRGVLRSLEYRNYVSRDALGAGPGDDARMASEDRVACGPVLVRVVHGGGDPVPRAARIEANRSRGLAGQDRNNVFGCVGGGASVAVGRVSFLPQASPTMGLEQLPEPVRALLLTTLAPAA